MPISRASLISFALVATLHLVGLGALLLIPSSPPKAEISAPRIQGVIIMAQAEPAPPPPKVQNPVLEKVAKPIPAKIKPVRHHKPHVPRPQAKQPSPAPRVEEPQPSAPAEVPAATTAAAVSTSTAPEPTPVIPPSSDSPQLHNPAPAYPTMSRKLREQGTVTLRLLVKANGCVESVSVKQSSGFKRLDDAALRSVRRWRFIPATQAGLAVDYWYELPVEFSLK